MTKFVEVIQSPQQRTGEFWQNAYDLLDNHSGTHIVESVDGDSMYITTPPIRPIDIPGVDAVDAEDRKVLGQTYAVAARTSDRRLDPNDVLYLIVNGNYATPVLQFQAGANHLTVMDSVFNEVEDGQKYVPTILEAIKTQDEHSQELALTETRARRSRRWRRAAKGVAAVALVALVGGATAGVVIKGNQDTEHQQQQLSEFDAQDHIIDTETVSAGGIGYIESDPAFFDQYLPQAGTNEGYSDPRLVKLAGNYCQTITTLDPQTQAIRMVTAGDKERLFATVRANGEVKACFTDNQVQSETKIAVQVVDKPLS